MPTYEGSCHCGAVKWEATMDAPQKAFAGNCSMCGRMGWLLAFVPAESFRLISGDDTLRDYQFAKQNTHHLFCSTCGIRSFARGKKQTGEATVALNLRCVKDFDATKLEVQTFDCAKL